MRTVPTVARMPDDPDVEDGIHYPSSDGEPMAETDYHITAIMLLMDALRYFFRNRPDVLVASNMFWFWERGNPFARRAPDVMVVPRVGNHPRFSFRSWNEGGAVPALIIELTSYKTWQEDIGPKFELYQRLGVREYFVFDPLSRYVSPTFQGYRLKAGRYRPIRPAADRSLASEFGVRFRRQKRLLRVLEGDASEPIPSFVEIAAQKEELARQNEHLEAELRRLRRRSAGGNGA
jgi:Uma2 family endonuclease